MVLPRSSPAPMERVAVLGSFSAVSFTSLTVTLQVADLPLPSLAVALMVALPSPTEVTRPFWSTVATASLEEVQVTV